MFVNRVKQMMLAGRPALGAVCQLGSPIAAETLALAGSDFVLVDGQHGAWEPASITAALRGIYAAGSVPMARVQKNDFAAIGALLDQGALGIVVPLVNSAGDAQRAVYATRYPPAGGRSLGPFGCWLYGRDYLEWANDQIFLAVQIESKEAVEQVDEILSVEGVDGCWIGPSDLAASMGLDLRQPDDVRRHEQAIFQVLQACKRLGKVPGIASGPMERILAEGYLFVTPVIDQSGLRGLATDRLAALRQVAEPITHSVAS
jgi:4-hydroxy-2-oxoheptanedioate aldolase